MGAVYIFRRLMAHLPSAYDSSAIGLWLICYRLMAHLPLSWCVSLHQTVCQKESVAVRYQCKVTPIYLKTCRNRHYFGIFFEKREKTLEKLANRLADKVVKTKRSVRLEPMNPYERKVIHATLQSKPRVTTRSEGQDPYRRVIIELK